jgi:hypothetical protein
MSVKGKSLHVLTPMYGGMCTGNFLESFVNLVMTMSGTMPLPGGQRIQLPFALTYSWNESLISRGRNRLVDAFLKNSECTHALMIDADIGFKPSDVLAMLEWDKPVIAAPCAKKSLRWDRVQKAIRAHPERQFTNEEMEHIAADFVFNFERFDGNRSIQLQEVQSMRNMGAALMLVRREVFEAIRERFPERWYKSLSHAEDVIGPVHDFFRVGVNPETHIYDSEDYWFCMDAKACGFEIGMAPWVVTSHQGSYKFIADMPAVAALAGAI